MGTTQHERDERFRQLMDLMQRRAEEGKEAKRINDLALKAYRGRLDWSELSEEETGKVVERVNVIVPGRKKKAERLRQERREAREERARREREWQAGAPARAAAARVEALKGWWDFSVGMTVIFVVIPTVLLIYLTIILTAGFNVPLGLLFRLGVLLLQSINWAEVAGFIMAILIVGVFVLLVEATTKKFPWLNRKVPTWIGLVVWAAGLGVLWTAIEG